MINFILLEKHRKNSFAVDEGVFWRDIIDPNNRKEKSSSDITHPLFLDALTKSYEKNLNTGGSLSHLLLDRFKLTSSSLIEARIIFANQYSSFNVHDDAEHIKASNDHVTIHLNLFRSEDYLPGSTGSGPWSVNTGMKSKFSQEGYIKGYLGEKHVLYNKAEQKFSTNLEKRNVTSIKGGGH